MQDSQELSLYSGNDQLGKFYTVVFSSVQSAAAFWYETKNRFGLILNFKVETKCLLVFLILPYLALTLVTLDGMARNYFFIYMDMQEHEIQHVWIHLIPISLYPRREEKHLA